MTRIPDTDSANFSRPIYSYEVLSSESIVEVECIFSVELAKDKKTVVIAEECDRYYKGRANKHQLSEIIQGLTRLRDQMEDPEGVSP